MKRLLALTLVILVLSAAPALAVLRILPEEVQARLHGLALEEYPGYQVEESWVQDFVATGREVFNISLVNGDEKVLVRVDIAAESVLSEEAFEAVVQAENDAQAENPVFTIMEATDAGQDDVDLVNPDSVKAGEESNVPWVAGGLVALALAGGVALYLKKK